ncbi:hypothetical protein ABPG77_000203 [Micractinium sp. CCAP 211/92]
MKTIAQRSCAIQGIAQEDCWSTTWKLTLLFGASQCLLSQVKNLESAWWVSSIGVATSLTYSTIALVLGCVYSGAHAGSVGGISANTPNKAFGVLNALGGIAFAYSFSLILLEIQDTLRQPPSTTKTMKGAVNIGVTASFMFYFTVAVVGYCALGNDVPGMVLAGFPQAPNWVIMLANVCILIHMLAAFQTYAQPMYDTIESWIKALMLRREQGKAPQGAAVKTEPAPTAATEEGRVTVTRSEDSAHHLNRRSVRNTAPVPTLRPSMGYGRTSVGYDRTSVGSGGRSPEARSPGLGRHSQGSIVHALERLSMVSSMYHVDTGFTNEAVPLNDELYFVPLWVRLIVRTLYVIVVTVLAVVMPFFGSIVGLIGAATFLPLAIYFPYLMVLINSLTGNSSFAALPTLNCMPRCCLSRSAPTVLQAASTKQLKQCCAQPNPTKPRTVLQGMPAFVTCKELVPASKPSAASQESMHNKRRSSLSIPLDNHVHLLKPSACRFSFSLGCPPPPRSIPNDKTGNVFTAVMHIFCAVVGAGVLALPSTVAWMGWVAGPIMIVVFYVISLISSNMLAEVYCVDNIEFARYHHAVRYVLGRFNAILLSIAQLSNLFLITVRRGLVPQAQLEVPLSTLMYKLPGRTRGAGSGPDHGRQAPTGAVHAAWLLQVRNLESAWWVSSIGVATSLTYSTIALVLGCVYSGARAGNVAGIQANTPNKAFGVLNALGSIAFAYSFSLILLEIQDTLKQPPSARKTMKRAVNVGVTASFMFYFTVAVVGYCALGNDVPSMVLAGFPQAPNWVIMLANVCILVHMLAAFQPMYDTIESWIKALMLRREQGKAPQVRTLISPVASSMYHVDTGFTNEAVPLNDERYFVPLWIRLIVRTLYVVVVTVLAMVMPFFGSIVGLIGAATFLPLAIYFPYLMYNKVYKPRGLVKTYMWVTGIFMGLVCGAATVAAVRGIIVSWSTYTIFGD